MDVPGVQACTLICWCVRVHAGIWSYHTEMFSSVFLINNERASLAPARQVFIFGICTSDYRSISLKTTFLGQF